MGMDFWVDPDKCVHCGRCVMDCNPRALELDAVTRLPRWAENGEARCFRCQHCLAICPVGAVSIMGAAAVDSEEKRPVPDAAELLNLIRCRRSFRSYRNEDLDRDVLEKLKAMLAYTPTGVNDHRLFFSFIDDAAVMAGFRREFLGRLLALVEAEAPGAERFARYRKRLLDGDDVVFRGAPHMVLACTPASAPCADVDPVIALSYFELYAQSLGVGTLWCGLFKWALTLMPEFLERFGLPEGYIPGYAMMFGPSGLRYPRSTQPPRALTFSVGASDVDRA